MKEAYFMLKLSVLVFKV